MFGFGNVRCSHSCSAAAGRWMGNAIRIARNADVLQHQNFAVLDGTNDHLWLLGPDAAATKECKLWRTMENYGAGTANGKSPWHCKRSFPASAVKVVRPVSRQVQKQCTTSGLGIVV